MERVAVVGCGGAGKSTFASALGDRAGLPVIHLDEHFWHPGWVETPRDEWIEVQRRLVDGERWVIDGNYGGTLDVRFERADTIVVLALPRTTCVAGVLRRVITRHGNEVQAAGCPERFDMTFVRWVWNYDRDSRPRVDAALDRHRDSSTVIELRSRREVAAFLDRVAPAGGVSPRS